MLLHKDLPENSELCAVCHSLSTTQFPFVIDLGSTVAHCDTPGFEWGMAVEELQHGTIVILHQFFLPVVSQHHPAYVLQLRLELLRINMSYVPGSHKVFPPQQSPQVQ